MIVWSGSGLLVPLVAFVFGGLFGMLGEYLGKQLGASSDSGFVVGLGVGLFCAGFSLFYVARWLRRSDRVLVDPNTNQQVVLRDRSSLFFVPVAAWSWLLMAYGIGSILFVAAIAVGLISRPGSMTPTKKALLWIVESFPV